MAKHKLSIVRLLFGILFLITGVPFLLVDFGAFLSPSGSFNLLGFYVSGDQDGLVVIGVVMAIFIFIGCYLLKHSKQ